ncbi:MAG TPA: hypothetical protein VLZ83_06355 [Edaphocola sp.]|nr:hypothetical protein [Edaphocola sp.]
MKIIKISIALLMFLGLGLNYSPTFAQTQAVVAVDMISKSSFQQSLDAYNKASGAQLETAYNVFLDKTNALLADRKANLPAVPNVNETPEYKEFENIILAFNALTLAKRSDNKQEIMSKMKNIIKSIQK